MVSYHSMVSHQNGVTRGGPPQPPSYATALADKIKVLILTVSTFILAIFHSRVMALFHSQDT